MTKSEKKKNLPSDLENIMPLLLGVWRRLHKLSGPPDKLQTREFRRVVSAIQYWKNYFEKNEAKSPPLADLNEKDLIGAYFLYYWVVHYQQGLSLLGEIPSSIGRVLDLASGTAPFSFAALRHGAREVIALDNNLLSLQLGAEICGRYGFPLTIRKQTLLKNPLPEEPFDLIIVGHALADLFDLNAKNHLDSIKSWITLLLDKLSPSGYLLIVDSSLPLMNQKILQLRNFFVEKKVPVQAPCVWQGACPALEAKSLCYAQREMDKPYLLKEIQRAANINASSLKMSYLLLKNPKADWPVLESSKQFYRVTSPPINSHKGNMFHLCGTNGAKTLVSHLADHPKESKAFEYLKRGELISLENAIERGSQFDITLGTRLVVDAPIGKPVD